MPQDPIPDDLSTPDALLAALLDLRQAVYEEGQQTFATWRNRIQRQRFLPGALNLAYYPGALNLAYYLALRRRDLRPLQAALVPWGLSSLGRLENRVMPNLDAVLATLGTLCQSPPANLPPRPRLSLFARGERPEPLCPR